MLKSSLATLWSVCFTWTIPFAARYLSSGRQDCTVGEPRSGSLISRGLAIPQEAECIAWACRSASSRGEPRGRATRYRYSLPTVWDHGPWYVTSFISVEWVARAKRARLPCPHVCITPCTCVGPWRTWKYMKEGLLRMYCTELTPYTVTKFIYHIYLSSAKIPVT